VPGVVVGMSGTAGSGNLVRWASAEASLRGAPLHLVHAWRAPVELSMPLPADLLPDMPGPATSTAVQGEPAEVLLGQHPDLLVLGGHTGAPHVSRVAKNCLGNALCPVVVVPDVERTATGRVVVAVCGTEMSCAALRWAASEARMRADSLVVIYVWQPALVRTDLLHPAAPSVLERDAAVDRMRGWVHTSLGRDDVELHAVPGGPLDALLDASVDADLLVVGRSRPRSALGRLTHASVSSDLSGLVPCPVAVVPVPA
jgi:nucleotide-binding universal stress UspA family protein